MRKLYAIVYNMAPALPVAISVSACKEQIVKDGFTIIENIFSEEEIRSILHVIGNANTQKSTFRRNNDLFAIRQFLKELPEIKALIFTPKLKSIIAELFGPAYSAVKSIYFDKPARSNWFVAYHQDLTISVDKKMNIEGFGPWTIKQDQFAVQPPVEMLEDNFTIRIHLDDTDENNGALKVISASHLKGICRFENIDRKIEREVSCKVKKGGIMIMRPLLFHASNKTINDHKRRVIHIEFSNKSLPASLQWAEHL